MEDHDNYLEENLKRLIKTSCTPKPDAILRQQVFNLLIEQSKSIDEPFKFPTISLILMIFILSLLAMCFAFQLYISEVLDNQSILFQLSATILMINVLFIPISGVTIVLRRRIIK